MIRKCIHCLFICLAAFPWLWWRISAIYIGKVKAFQGMSQFCSLFPGITGELFRAAFYRLSLEQTSQRTSIAFLTTFSNPKAHIKEHVSIGSHCNIGWATLGKNCILSSFVCITSGKNQHNFEDLNTPIRLQEGTYTAVSIGANCWVGANATIMADVGEGSIIAAGAVVTKTITTLYSIAVRVAATIIRSRQKQNISINESSHNEDFTTM